MLRSQRAKLLKQTVSLVVCLFLRESVESLGYFHKCYKKMLSFGADLDLDLARHRETG